MPHRQRDADANRRRGHHFAEISEVMVGQSNSPWRSRTARHHSSLDKRTRTRSLQSSVTGARAQISEVRPSDRTILCAYAEACHWQAGAVEEVVEIRMV
jgi:hypothetical protein